MKKKIVAPIIFLFTLQVGFAQDKGYLGITFGPAFPVGDFASTDIEGDESGYATTGIHFDFTFAYKLGESFGLAAQIASESFGMDAGALADDFSELDPSLNWEIETENWTLSGLLIGGYGSWPVSEKVSFDLRAMIGYVVGTIPDIKITASDGFGYNATLYQSGASGGTVGFKFGGGFKFDVGERVCLLLNLDFMTAKPELEIKAEDPTIGFEATDTFDQPINSMNLGFGIAYRL